MEKVLSMSKELMSKFEQFCEEDSQKRIQDALSNKVVFVKKISIEAFNQLIDNGFTVRFL